MPTITAPQTRIDAYLAEFRTHLRSLPHEQMLDIVEEIRSHLRDTAEATSPMTEASLNAALHRLGPASALAATYLTENLLARAAGGSTPTVSRFTSDSAGRCQPLPDTKFWAGGSLLSDWSWR